MRSIYTLLIVSLFFTTGCGKKNRLKTKARKSFLMMVNSPKEVTEWVSNLANEVNESATPEKRLLSGLDEMFSNRKQNNVIFSLFDKIKKPFLKKYVLEYYAENSSEEIPKDFMERVRKSGQYLSSMMDIYFASETILHAKELEQLYRKKKRVTLKEILQLSELLMNQGKFAESSKYLLFHLKNFPKESRKRASFLLGKMAFFQENYKVCNSYLKPLFHLPKYKKKVVDYIVDSFILQKEFLSASKFIEVYRASDFTNAHPHVLKSKIFLFSNHYKVALKQWIMSKNMGADSIAFQIQSFYLSHYYPREVQESDMGIFASWKKENIGFIPPIKSLDFQSRRSYVNQYNLLSRKDSEILSKIGKAYRI
ncbi:MAG: hypothetical protein COB02_14660 [Candidatus Cloacimonadota bacterium]|nr:MAG: hypothetical protein COB02_14660 [Candidatus Cloacimonadota bacterium]